MKNYWTPLCKPNVWSLTVGYNAGSWTIGIDWHRTPSYAGRFGWWNGSCSITLHLPLVYAQLWFNIPPKGEKFS
jgi:hypothetical protein